jgi:hypothetical protein
MADQDYTIIQKKTDVVENPSEIKNLMINGLKKKLELSCFNNLTNLIIHDYKYIIDLTTLSNLKYLLINNCLDNIILPLNIKLHELIIYNYSKKIQIDDCSELKNVEMENCSSDITFHCEKLKLDTYRNDIILPNKIKELSLSSNDVIDNYSIHVYHDNDIEQLSLNDYTGFIDIKNYKKIKFLEISCMEFIVNYEKIIPNIHRLEYLQELILIEVEPIKITSKSLKKLTIYCNDYVYINCENLELFTGKNKDGFNLTKCMKLKHLCCDILSVENLLLKLVNLTHLELINVKNNYVNLSNCYFLKTLKFIRGEGCFRYNIDNCINIVDISFENMNMNDDILDGINSKLYEIKKKQIAGLFIKNELKKYISKK